MAVRRDLHQRGVGRRLVAEAERRLVADGAEFLTVKTLSPERPDPSYERTRAFFRALGFKPLETSTPWDPGNPCLQLIKHLPSTRSPH